MPGASSKKLPKGKAWSHHSDREDVTDLRAKLLKGLGHPLYCMSDSSKQKLNKLKPPPQSVNFTGRLLLQLGKSPLYDSAHPWLAKWNNVPFLWNYSLQSVSCECTCSVLCRKTDPSWSRFKDALHPQQCLPHKRYNLLNWIWNSCCKVNSSTLYFMFFYTEKHSNSSYCYPALQIQWWIFPEAHIFNKWLYNAYN